MIITTITLRIKSGTYTIPVRSKFTIVQGDSGVGKSLMIKRMTRLPEGQPISVLPRIENVEDYLDLPAKPIALIDESVLAELDKDTIRRINESPCQYVFLTRKIPAAFAVDYRDIYTLVNPSRGIYKCVRTYPD